MKCKYLYLSLIFFLPSLAIAQPSHKTENVFLITLDGFRWQELFTGADASLVKNKDFAKDPLGLSAAFWDDAPEVRRKLLMPFFWTTIAQEGQLYGNREYGNNVNCSNTMWFSYPGYHEILCGFADDTRINSNKKINNPNVTVLEFLNGTKAYKGKVAAFASWDVMPFIVNEARSGIPVNGGYETASGAGVTPAETLLNTLQSEIPGAWGGVRFDAFTHHYALEYLKREHPKVVFISYGETDDFAHDGQYDHYLKSARRTDQFIRELWQWVQSHSAYKNRTTFIITTDHGRGTLPHGTWQNHGDEYPGADQIWLAIIGPDTPATGEQKLPMQLYQSQVASTAAALLGLKYTSEGRAGKVITTAFGK